MTQAKRKIFFWLAVTAFVVITPLIIGYAQGYRFDFQRREVTRVGAILVDSEPKKANVWVNNKKTNSKTSAAIKNLLPFRAYNIKVEKEGFAPWEKQLEVEPEKITTAKNIILFPLSPGFQGFANDDLKSLSVSPNGEKIFGIKNNEQLFIKDTSSFSSNTLTFTDNLTTLGIDKVLWSQNNEHIILSRQTRDRSLWYLLDTTKNEMTNITQLYENKLFFIAPTTNPLPRKFNTKKITFLNNDNKRIVALIENDILIIDMEEQTFSRINVDGAKNIEVHGKKIFVLKDTDALILIDNNGENIVELESLRFAPQDMIMSPDKKKLAYFHNYTVGMLWLEDSNDSMQRKKSEQDIIFQSIHPIKQLVWHKSSNYMLALLENGEIVISEIDVRGNQNTVSWLTNNVSQFAYSPQENSIWILKKDGAVLRHLEEK